MLRFPLLIAGMVVVLMGCGDSTQQTGCLEAVNPRDACVQFDEVNRRCESLLPIELSPVDLAELCECQLVAVADDYPVCEATWEAENECLGALECEDYVAFLNGEPDAPCLDEIAQTNEVCVDENGLPVGS